MAGPEFPPRMFRPGYEPEPDKSIHYFSGKRDLMDALQQALEESEWEELRNSAFGVFVMWHELDFVWCSRMVHYMLCNQLEVDQKHEVWCLLGLQPVRFSLHEFQEITGLNCNYVENLEYPEVEYTPAMRTMWELLGVGEDVGPSYNQLLEACKRCEGWERQDRIWLGYLAIYASFIDAQHWTTPSRADMTKMLLKPGALDSYPWGRLAFKILVDSVKTEVNKKLQEDKNYQISGFAEVLNVWIYWACPGMATVYGAPLPNDPAPPLLAYKGSRNRKKVDSELRKQTRLNNFVLKPFDEMFPRWDDGVDDAKVVNIVKAMFGRFEKPWRWSFNHWNEDTVVPPGPKKTLSKGKGVKRKNSEAAHDGGDEKRAKYYGGTDGEVGYLIKTVGNQLLEEMGVVLRMVNEGFKVVGDRITGIENEVRLLRGGKPGFDGDGVSDGDGGGNKKNKKSKDDKKNKKDKKDKAKFDKGEKSNDGGGLDGGLVGGEDVGQAGGEDGGCEDGGVDVDGAGIDDVDGAGIDDGDTTIAALAVGEKAKKDARKNPNTVILKVPKPAPSMVDVGVSVQNPLPNIQLRRSKRLNG